MNLSTITSKDFPQKSKLCLKPEVLSLKTSDIEGARPQLKGYRYMNKPDYKYHPEERKPRAIRSLGQEIEFKAYRVPNRNLPSFELAEVPPPKFIRDSLVGVEQPTPLKIRPRDHIDVSDIEGTSPKRSKSYNKPDFHDPRDIVRPFFQGLCKDTNPLMPSYKLRDEDGNSIVIGDVEGSKPKQVFSKSNWNSLNLSTGDIDGASPGTVGVGAFLHRQRRYNKSTTEIEGAKTGTLRKGIKTLRNVHPLNPIYDWEPKPKEEKKTENEVEVSKEFLENSLNFWGVNSKPLQKESKTEEKVDRYFQKNLDKFYCITERSDFSNSRKMFYDDPTHKNRGSFQTSLNPGSIHRKPYKIIKGEPKGFRESHGRFYGETSTPEPRFYQFRLRRENIEPPRHKNHSTKLSERSARIVKNAKSLL